MIIAALVIGAIVLGLYATAAFWVNWWWFGSIGYRSVLLTRYQTQLMAFLAGGLAAAAFFTANWIYSLRRSAPQRLQPAARPQPGRAARLPLWALTVVVFVASGSLAAGQWQTWLLLFAGREFGVGEPVLDHDAGFYVFTLPALTALQRGALVVLLATIALVVVLYAVRLRLSRFDLSRPPLPVRTHVLALGGGVLLLLGAGYLLANYRLLYSTRGVVYGPGFTDAMVSRWANYALAAISAAAAALLLLNAVLPRLRWLLFAFGAWAVAAVLLGGVLPGAVQQTVVEPNELRREQPFIANNIALTRAAFDLDQIQSRDLSGQGEPPAAALSPQAPAFANVRLWDYRIARTTFQQLRSFVPYYVFHDVDVDRYVVDGQLRQVLISARELDVNGLPRNAQTWVNRHLAYTHGYGAVVSPVSEATTQGLPIFLVGGIPPEAAGPLTIERPEIYFGELPGPWVAVNTGQAEVSGIPGETVPASYEGAARGSISLHSYFRRLILATFLGDRRVLLSGELTDESRVLLRRGIVERAQAVAPFLSYDPDPYLVIADGRFVWVIDAYTTSDRFPGSTPIDGINYARHTTKVVVDAYDGTMTFYRTATPDPIADAYAAIFDDLFTPIADAPPSISEHFRYPERLFDLQSEVFASYHVTDPTSFYNGEDRWTVAQEQLRGETRRMEAYYVTQPLPGETQSQFGLVLPFTPNNRPNMTAWMAAHIDATGQPRLLVYRFPRQANIFGPQQIEARINQDPEISSQITLLDQAGSRVIRGNLLVIPIEQTVLYVQPLYLQATATEGAPTELQFVIMATNERVVMRRTLPDALLALSGREAGAEMLPARESPESRQAIDPDDETAALLQQALDAYDRGQDALARGDWAAYGREQATLEAILRRLAGERGDPLPAATPLPDATPGP